MNPSPKNHTMPTGLSQHEVQKLRERSGENRLPSEKPIPAWLLLLNQFKSPLVYIILVAALVSLAMGEIGDFALIMAVIAIDVVMGFAQEFRAQRTYNAMKTLLRPTTTVVRNGQRIEIEVWELVPGDIVVLNAGEKSPGDGELIESTKLAVDEAILTGESEPVNKHPDGEENEEDGQNKVFAGTTILTGRGLMRVTAIGTSTKLGQIAASLSLQVEEDTPLQIRLRAFSRVLTFIVVGFTATIFIVGLIMGYNFFEMLRTSIVLAIAAIPEGILIAVTVILVLGMRKILKRNGLVKRLLAVETLGSVSVICTDKTGTITEGRMQVTRANLINERYAWQTMVLCNDLEGPVDIALWEYAEKQIPSSLQEAFKSPQELFDNTKRLNEEIFTSETKFMATSVTGEPLQNKHFCFLKGAPEIVLDMCAVTSKERAQILAQVDEWADQGLRLLGLAYRFDGAINNHTGYTWLGLLGMEDPVRQGVIDAINVAHQAGVQIKMITGDYRRTAERIAHNIGLTHSNGLTLEGIEIAKLSDEQLRERVGQAVIFSRIYPQDKLRIIKALQENGEIAAMIGDGVNDAPALKCANIGVVVNSATDVAKETADLILLDSNFATIVAAIEEGRVIFANIRKVVAYTLSNSFAEVLTIFMAMMFNWPAPLAIAQILWIHLICDGPSDIVLGFEPKEKGIMREKPRPLKAPILTHLSLTLIGVISAASAIFGLILFGYFYLQQGDAAHGQSIVFASFSINSMIYIFAYRSLRRPLVHSGSPMANKYLVWTVLAGVLTALIAFWVPGLRQVLGLVSLSWLDWLVVAGIAITLLGVVEVGKAIANRLHPND